MRLNKADSTINENNDSTTKCLKDNKQHGSFFLDEGMESSFRRGRNIFKVLVYTRILRH